MYAVRDQHGTLIMTIENSDALRMMNNIKGHFRQRTDKRKITKTVYEISEDITNTIGNTKIYLWAGTVIIPE